LPPRRPLRIFHITPIPNLASVAKSEKLYANSLLQKRKIGHENIAYQHAQGKRATKLVAKPPGGVIHDYVPFYFAPRSPMLGAINQGTVEGCEYRQQDIVHLVTTVEAVVDGGLTFVFYDHNATLDYADCYNNLRDLDKIEWDLFYESPRLDGYCQYWFSTANNPKYIRRMETRQAEFLVHRIVPLNLITCVGVRSEEKAEAVRQIFDDEDIDILVEVKRDWYF
jgi:hypothetical protein